MFMVVLEIIYGLIYAILYSVYNSTRNMFRSKFSMNIKGEIVRITEGGSGIGRLIARKLANLGATIVTLAVKENGNDETVEMIRRDGNTAHGFVCELNSKREIYSVSEIARYQVRGESNANSISITCDDHVSTSAYDSGTTAVVPSQRVQNIVSIATECTTFNELHNLIENNLKALSAYDGIELIGKMTIEQGLMKTLHVNQLSSSGVSVIYRIVTRFAMHHRTGERIRQPLQGPGTGWSTRTGLKDNVSGNLDKINIIGNYLIECWRATGMKLENVHFVWDQDDVFSMNHVLLTSDILKSFTTKRLERACPVKGRNRNAPASLHYAAMQCADILLSKTDLCTMSMDQREVVMLAREYIKKKKGCVLNGVHQNKPILLAQHVLQHLRCKPRSKSDTTGVIFMDDDPETVSRKINLSVCPAKVTAVHQNPCLDHVKHIVFGWNGCITVKNTDSCVNTDYTDYVALEMDFRDGKITPQELKAALAKSINSILTPIRRHFATNPRAKKLEELVETFRV